MLKLSPVALSQTRLATLIKGIKKVYSEEDRLAPYHFSFPPNFPQVHKIQ
jgi:hypothetical protein